MHDVEFTRNKWKWYCLPKLQPSRGLQFWSLYLEMVSEKVRLCLPYSIKQYCQLKKSVDISYSYCVHRVELLLWSYRANKNPLV